MKPLPDKDLIIADLGEDLSKIYCMSAVVADQHQHKVSVRAHQEVRSKKNKKHAKLASRFSSQILNHKPNTEHVNTTWSESVRLEASLLPLLLSQIKTLYVINFS